MQNGSEIILIVASDGTVEYCSPSVTHFWIWHRNISLAASCGSTSIRRTWRFATLAGRPRARLRADHQSSCELRLRRRDGTWLHTEVVGRDGRSNPAVDGFVLNEQYVVEPGAGSRPTRWRFHLRKGVKFHNGDPFTADDVLFSADRVRKKKARTCRPALLPTSR